MSGYITNIEKRTIENSNYRQVLYTAKHMQLVIMSLKPGEEIGEEIHKTIDQFFRFEAGNGKVVINEKEFEVEDGSSVIIPAGNKHNIVNTSESEDLKLYTIYSPPHHPDKTLHKIKDNEKGEEFINEKEYNKMKLNESKKLFKRILNEDNTTLKKRETPDDIKKYWAGIRKNKKEEFKNFKPGKKCENKNCKGTYIKKDNIVFCNTCGEIIGEK